MIFQDLNHTQLNSIVSYRKMLPPAEGNAVWVTNAVDPFQKIVSELKFSKQFSDEEINQWVNRQEVIIKEKLKS